MPEIQISNKTRKLIRSFGLEKETDDKIIRRIYDFAVKEQLRRFLMSDENCISIDEARKIAEEKWPKKIINKKQSIKSKNSVDNLKKRVLSEIKRK